MPESQGGHIGVLAERVKGVQEDVAELRQQMRDDHHRLRGLEAAVQQMVDAQKTARESEADNTRRMSIAIAAGGLLMSLSMVALTVVTIILHNH